MSNLVHNHPQSNNNQPITMTDATKFPLAGNASDGWSNEDEATATCFCGAVQISFVRDIPFFTLPQAIS
jgi:hypothetical protein